MRFSTSCSARIPHGGEARKLSAFWKFGSLEVDFASVMFHSLAWRRHIVLAPDSPDSTQPDHGHQFVSSMAPNQARAPLFQDKCSVLFRASISTFCLTCDSFRSDDNWDDFIRPRYPRFEASWTSQNQPLSK